MKSEEGIQILDFTNELGMIPLREVANINEVTINPKSLDWLNYTDISSVGARTVETPLMVSGQDAPSRARRVLRNGDTVISTVRPNRKSYFLFRDNWDRAIASTGFAVISPKNFQDSEYLHAVLTTDAATAHYESLCEGGAYPAFNPHAIENMQIPWPSRQERELVGSLSSAILRKIETNVRLSNSLESIAQVIFKSWFIDFDPVKAKIAGEKPVGLNKATSALIPDSMEDSELGPIPTEWTVGTMAELFGLQGGFSFKSSSWTEDGVPVIKIGSVKPGLVDLNQVSYVDEVLAQKTSSAYRLPRGSLVIGLTGYVGEVGLLKQHREIPLLNQRVAKFLPVNGTWKIPFIYCLTRRPQFKQRVIDAANGSAQQNVSNSQILSLQTLVPPIELVESFNDQFESLFDQILLLAEQNDELSQLRDSLLPRLISGELQIPEEMLVP